MGNLNLPLAGTGDTNGTLFQITQTGPTGGSGGIAILGESYGTDSRDGSAGTGVQGKSDVGTGIEAFSTTGIALQATTQSGSSAIFASNGPSRGFIAGTDPHYGRPTGIFGESEQFGVYGSATGAGGTGVYGNGGTTGFGIRGDCTHNVDAAIKGVNRGTGPAIHGVGALAGQFDGKLVCTGDHTCGGTLNVAVDVVLAAKAQDCAEDFDVAEPEVDAGSVVVINELGSLQRCGKEYDKRVAGVISGAGGLRPGVLLGREESHHPRMPVALVGRAYCKVDASYSPVAIGDLLTTSPTLGHAMRATDTARSFGAVIGKALRPLEGGQGLIPILIALQ
jgi:hypothetical protein